MVLVFRDVSERRAAELDALRLAAIVEGSQDAIIGKDLQGVIRSWNPGAERIFGYGEDEAVGKPVTILLPPDRLAEEAEILERLRGAPWRPWLLNVTVHDGVADLWGIANALEEKTAAGVAAENAPGVVAVHNHIIVRPHSWAEAKPYFSE